VVRVNRARRYPSVTAAAALATALALAAAGRPLAAQQTSAYEELQAFSTVLNHIRLNYADSVSYHELVHAAIDGMLRSLDPHSYFLSRADWERRSAFERGETSRCRRPPRCPCGGA